MFEGDFGAFGMGGGNFRDPVMVPWSDLGGMAVVEELAGSREESDA